jgi:hypothetical protein
VEYRFENYGGGDKARTKENSTNVLGKNRFDRHLSTSTVAAPK